MSSSATNQNPLFSLTGSMTGTHARIASGTPNADTMEGTELADYLSGHAGNDIIRGHGGNDELHGGAGDDVLEGGAGNDRLNDVQGNDKLYGGDGDDVLGGSTQPNFSTSTIVNGGLLDGGDGNDQLTGYNGYHFAGGAGDDSIFVMVSALAPAGGIIDGGTGADTFRYQFDPQARTPLTMTGGAGADTFILDNMFYGGGAQLRITDFSAGVGGDRIDVTPVLYDRLAGKPYMNPFTNGALRLMAEGADTVLQALYGTEYRSYVILVGVQPSQLGAANFVGGIDPAGGEAGLALSGTASDDTLTGNLMDDVLAGGDGNDVLGGRSGNDRLDGGNGDDRLEGDAGSDVLLGGEGNDRLVDWSSAGDNQLFGGAGNDSLSVGSTGNDLLDGGPGNDWLESEFGFGAPGAGLDTLRGGDGDDTLFGYGGAILEGGDGNDSLVRTGGGAIGARLDGGDGDDLLVGHSMFDSPGDTLVGGAGFDRAQYQSARAGYTVTSGPLGVEVRYTSSGGADLLVGVERIQFDDLNVALDLDGFAGQAYRIYRAAFDRAPDLGGMGFWLSRMDRGTSLTEIAGGFTASQEFADLYGSAPSNTDLVTRMYTNVLHRTPDAGGHAFWVDVLDTHKADLPTVLAAISESAENKAAVAELIANGIPYTPYAG